MVLNKSWFFNVQLTHVAQWKKLISKTVTYRPGPSKGSQIPGVELFDIENGQDINIGQQLIMEGLALPSTTGYFGDLVNSSVLKLEPDTPVLQKSNENTPERESSIEIVKESLPETDPFKIAFKGPENNPQAVNPKVNQQNASVDFLTNERANQLNGNNTEPQDTNSNGNQPDVKMWSDLLKND